MKISCMCTFKDCRNSVIDSALFKGLFTYTVQVCNGKGKT
jgi:hypothetical protein